ncbi:MAG: Na/Pi symporter, partial [Lachnospiraceae bacterium]|nr:Na/Pi symporter [Lachnospiraceae bacterium]
MNIVMIIVSLLGGLALFLYGMGIMSSTLSNMTGGSLDRVIGKITRNRYIGFGVGAALTALVQSSSATTVLTVGFVNAGIMKLNEAFGFVVGANLGATMNAWILSLNSVEGGTILLDLCKPSCFFTLFRFSAKII